MELEKQLNAQQYLAATNVNSHTRIIAGAGSGKTRVLTYRIAYLVKELGIDPRKILAITFTNKAANEMKERVEAILGGTTLGSTICTIHSLCVRILREHIHLLGYPRYFVIMDTEDQKSVLKDIYNDLGVDVKSISYSSMISSISRFKYAKMSEEKLLESAKGFMGETLKARIYGRYLAYQEKNMCLDFDDLLLKTIDIFENFPVALESWQHRFQYIHVDEFQDVSQIEYNIVKFLAGKHNLVCVVGDPDQTIYSFRGADVNYIIDFDSDYENVNTIYLNQNYRSTKKILNSANTLIRHNTHRLEKDLYSNLDEGKDIIHYSGASPEEEANFVIDEINNIIENVEGVNYKDFAILYRASYLSRPFEQALLRNKMAYKIYGGLRFTERKEVKDVLSYLRVIAFQDDLAMLRIINVPGRGIGKKTLDKIINYCSIRGYSIYEGIKQELNEIGLSTKVKKALNSLIMMVESIKFELNSFNIDLVEAIDLILEQSGYMEMLKIDNEETRIENVLEIKNMASDFLKRYDGDYPLEEFLQELPLTNLQEDNEDDEQFISLMTIHMSKGLEFNYVFVIGLSDDVFPSFRSIVENGDDGLEEERRLAYVAFTRAKRQLYLCDSQGYSFVTKSPKLTSRFVDEIGIKGVSHKGKTQKFKTSDYINIHETAKEKIGNNNINDFKVGDHINHQMFGKGVIVKIDGQMIDVAFAMPYGIKTLLKNHQAISKL
ncbi:MAG: ATP-dependent helicase [Beduini sp.]